MTRGQLYSQALIELGFDSQDRRAHPLSVFLAADTVRAVAIPAYIDTHGDDALSLFCVESVLPVLFDSTRGRNYVQLPYQILGMEDNKGLVQVSLPQEDEGSFIGVKNGMLSVYSGLEAGGAAGRTIYWISGSRIYFQNLTVGATDILVKAIPTIYDLLDDNEQVPMPMEFNRIVIDGVKQALNPQAQVVQDRTNDNRSGV
jgi:hypothetical protein